MKSLFKALMLLVVVITVTSCASSSNSDAELVVSDGNNLFYTNQVTLEENRVEFDEIDDGKTIINGNFTIQDNTCSECEESEKK